jgi:hypothetical protein
LKRETMRSIGNLLTGISYSLLLFLLVLFGLSAIYLSFALGVAPDVPNSLGMAADSVRWVHVSPSGDSVLARPDTGMGRLVDADSAVLRLNKDECPIADSACAVEIRTTRRTPTLSEHFLRNARVMGLVFMTSWRKWQADRWLDPEKKTLLQVPVPLRPLLIGMVAGALTSLLVLLWFWLLLRKYLTGSSPEKPEPNVGESVEDAFERRLLRWLAGALLLIALGAFVCLYAKYHAELKGANQLIWLFVPFAVITGARVVGFLLAVAILPNMRVWTRRLRSLWGAFQGILIYGWWMMLIVGLLPLAIYAVRDHTGGVGLGAIGSLIVTRLLTSPKSEGTRRFALPVGLQHALLGAAVAAAIFLTVVFFAALITRYTGHYGHTLLVSGIVAVVLILQTLLVDQNRLSPHNFYSDRLAETYLLSELPDTTGRMRLYRDAMEMPLCCLHGVANHPGSATSSLAPWQNTAPYQLISAAINLAGSKDLTRKDRKSGYWLFSKLYCGSVHTGFRPTAHYRRGATRLAGAIAVSGAAASSGMGRGTFFAQAFATVLFNVRLGTWLQNPSDPKSLSSKEARVFWPLYLWREMVMATTESGRLVNISDGGHTGDNVGIYPLLQRRCKVIIACDAEKDTTLTFGSFTEALRHAYVDMGIDVDIDLTAIRRNEKTGYSQSHSAVGRIRYPDRPDQESFLIYLKSSLTGDEPEPVLNYKSDCPAFPHETTADQFFDDAQFESYRALGVHIARRTFANWVTSKWFPEVRQHHGPTPMVVTASSNPGITGS